MAFADRVQLIQRIEEDRKSRGLTYICSDRAGARQLDITQRHASYLLDAIIK